MNPLFYDENDHDQPKNEGYILNHSRGNRMEPPKAEHEESEGANHAADLIRRKVYALYESEPNAKKEAEEAQAIRTHRSKHQQFMYDLSTSGKSLAQIQTEWHNYYVGLPDGEKHEVWREFYAANARHPSAYTTYVEKQRQAETTQTLRPDTHTPQPAVIVSEHAPHQPLKRKVRSAGEIKKQLLDKVRASSLAQEKARSHLKSLLFGLTMGSVAVLIFLFSFFNEMVIAPFIQPSRSATNTPIILASDALAPSSTPEVIIPKINVQIPVVYDEPSTDEGPLQRALERGVIHYASTSLPGQRGNVAIFGHSSNNIFNKGRYKFAFVKLRTLEPGDVFHLTYNGKVYSYHVYAKQVVAPEETSVLNPVPDKIATATLITCDPPGTSSKRLVVWGEQISPDPAAAAAPTTAATQTPEQLSSDGPTLWSRLWNWMF